MRVEITNNTALLNLPGSQLKSQVLDALEKLSESGVPPKNMVSLIDVGSQEYLRYFEDEVIRSFVSRGGSTCKIYEGTYGAGKTHLLHLIEEIALKNGFLVANADLSQSIHFDNWRAIAKHILQNCVIQINGEMVRSLPKILEKYGEVNGNSDEFSDKGLPHTAFARAMKMALYQRYPSKLARTNIHKYLLGEKVTVTTLRAAGVTRVKNPLTNKNSELVIRTVCEGLSKVGAGGVLLLFDENEKTLKTSSGRLTKKLQRTANSMRRIVDAASTGRTPHLLTVFAVLPGFIEDAMYCYQALGQRIGKSPMLSGSPGWRSPVLNISDVNKFPGPDHFVVAVSCHFSDLIEREDAMQSMINEGMDVVQSTAGSDYRRPLLRRLATVALEFA